MDATQAPITQAITAKLKHLAARQKLIAQNIANADTPGYRTRELAIADFGAMVGRAGGKPVVRPSERMTALGGGRPPGHSGVAANETTPGGNSVVLEDELMKLADVQMEYAALTNIYKKQHAMMKIALGRGG